MGQTIRARLEAKGWTAEDFRGTPRIVSEKGEAMVSPGRYLPRGEWEAKRVLLREVLGSKLVQGGQEFAVRYRKSGSAQIFDAQGTEVDYVMVGGGSRLKDLIDTDDIESE